MATSQAAPPTRNASPMDMARAVSRPSLLAFGVGILAVLSGVLTYATVTGFVPVDLTPTVLVTLLAVNAIFSLALVGLIAWRLTRLWRARNAGLAGARLHVRLVAMFSLIAVTPAVFVAIFAAVTLNLGIETWFSARVQTALDNAVNVARQYVIEQGRHILLDAGEIADSIQHDRALFDPDNHNRVRLGLMIEKIAIMTKDRGLAGSFLIDSKGNELAKSAQLTYSLALKPNAGDIADARAGRIVVDGNPDTGIVHALIYLPFLTDAYLLVVRQVDPKVFGYFHRTKVAVSEYQRLEQNRSEVQLIFAALYVVVSLVVLLAAIWLGLWAANRLVRPISSLIGAAERITEGDLKARVEVERFDDEVGALGVAFNRMISQLDAQRTALVTVNRQNDDRRLFMETVLAGVSAGVIGLDHNGTITVVNRAAARLLDSTPEGLEGRIYSEAVPEMASLVHRAISEPAGRASGEVAIKRIATSRTLSVQISSERGAGSGGYVATFDDITDLVSAQRTAAWADVARRIAHEIKNPLTPIQLSAERLKRKYGKEVTTDPDIFAQCTDTIIRQVGDIGRMVDEFSSFARMPTPIMRRENVQELLHQAIFLQRVAHPGIAFETRLPKEPVYLECDGRLISQALTNVLKNAAESVETRAAKDPVPPGRIIIALESAEQCAFIRIIDNGLGLPQEHRNRLTEPYVTTRAKGTGLGLAIVRKIMEDHGGEITLTDADAQSSGAQVTLNFPRTAKQGNKNEQERIADRV